MVWPLKYYVVNYLSAHRVNVNINQVSFSVYTKPWQVIIVLLKIALH